MATIATISMEQMGFNEEERETLYDMMLKMETERAKTRKKRVVEVPIPSAEALEKWRSYIQEEYVQAENEMVKKSEAMNRQVGGTHYKDKLVQPWDVIDTFPHAEAIGFYRGNAIKYIMRAGDKGPAREDYEKAIHYLQKLLEIL